MTTAAIVLGVLGSTLIGTLSLSQPAKAPARKLPKERAAAAFACPDHLSEKACKSFVELREAGDPGVRVSTTPGGVAFVCFRQPDDEFFLFAVDGPMFLQTHFDPSTKRRVPDDLATSKRFGFMRAFVAGVEQGASAPIHYFTGEWTYEVGSSTFAADSVNREQLSDDQTIGVFVEESQVEARLRYKNTFQKSVDYRLVIQRSTGRFSEKYTEETSKVPFTERTGRCAKLN